MQETANRPDAAANEPQIGEYRGLPVTRRIRAVSERSVEQALVHETHLHPIYTASADPARPGSRVTLDFEGFFGDAPIADSRMENVSLCLGDGTLMPAAEQTVIGRRAGEVFRFDFVYPEDFRLEELAGRTAQFEITLHTVEQRSFPAPDEAFAQSQGYASLAAYKEALRQKKLALHEANADRVAEAELLDKAGDVCTVALPEALVKKLVEQRASQLDDKLRRSHMTLEQHCRHLNTTPEALLAEFRTAAERRLRSVAAARAIAAKENITATDAELDAAYQAYAEQREAPVEAIRRLVSTDEMAALVVTRKVQAFLLDHAKVTTVYEQPAKHTQKE